MLGDAGCVLALLAVFAALPLRHERFGQFAAALLCKLAHIGVGHALRGVVFALVVERVALVVPNALGDRRPFRDGVMAFRAEILCAFFLLKVGGMRAGALHHVGEQSFVFQNGAGLEQVVVEGLALVILHEQRGAQRVEKACFPNVDIRVMREHARFHIACGVDVQVAAPAGDAAADELAIVLKVKREQGLLLAHLADEAVEVLALVGVHHKRGGRADANGHVREDPREKSPLLDEPVEELLAGDGACVGAGIAA